MRYLLFLFFSISIFGQQTSKVDFINCNASVQPNAFDKSISGKVIYKFKVNSILDTIKIDAIKMTFTEMKINDKVVNFKNSDKELQLFEGFEIGNNTLIFNYKATPKQTLYFTGANDFDCYMCPYKYGQIWTQGQGKYTSHWLPSFDDVNEKVIFNLDIIFEKGSEVISNGKLIKNDFVDEKNLRTWQYRMKKPMSSYLVMMAIGNFDSKKFKSKSGIPLQLYLEKDDFLKFNSTYIYSAAIFDFLEAEIGVKYPWEIYKQVPVRDFLYAGMENTSATIFSRDFVVDSIGYNDRNYINVNAHELAHQWFGDLITAKTSKHHWLQEGFATYYALLAEKKIFGDDYFYNKLYESSLQLAEASKTDLNPILSEKASSLTFYQKGAMALFYLENQIGVKNFRKAVKRI
jgi:aminopeptidase N